jgi:flagellar biosynthesis/type III secretory pathway protein FliH
MSTLEMKSEIINEVSKINSDVALKQVLQYLHTLNVQQTQEQKPLNLSQHYDIVKEQYGNVLSKLAQ